MAENKFNYFVITTERYVKAKNKSEAEKLALGKRGVVGEVLSTHTDVERVSAVEVREMLEI
jgi:hypothetical protein